MIRLRHKLFIEFFRLFDLGLLVATLAYVSAYSINQTENHTSSFRVALLPVDGIGFALLIAGWASILGAFIRYDANRFIDLTPQLIRVLEATTGAALLVAIVGTIFSIGPFNIKTILLFWGITSTLALLSRISIHELLKLLRRSGGTCRHLLIIGNRQKAEEIASRIERKPELGYKIEGLMLLDSDESQIESTAERWPILGASRDLKTILQKGVVDEIIITSATSHNLESTFSAVRLGEQLGVVVRLLPERSDLSLLAEAQLEYFDGEYVVTFFREVLLWHLLAKRLLDITLSSILLLALSPLFLVVSILIKLTSPGPVFFAQKRVGMNRRQFKMYKFRSMYKDAEARQKEFVHLNQMDGPVFKILNDPRITPIGRKLRVTSIDELPQLWNVLKGDMSLVGPRPPIISEVHRYEWLNHHRLSIRPGITCLWQISGRSDLNFQQWMDLDRKYIESWSFWLDLTILAKTIPAVLLRKGAA